jgi:soluble lytic murein transglycosylase-like protein
MSAIRFEDPWIERGPWKRLRSGSMINISQVWVVLLVLFNLALLGWLGVNWTLNSMKLSEQDAQITSLSEDVDWTEARRNWASSYVRVKNAVNSVAEGKMTPRQVGKLTETLWVQSRTYGFDPVLIVAVMQVESRSNPSARGHFSSGTESGALGLMQIKLATAQIMGKSLGLVIHEDADLMKPEVNLLLGTYYLMRLIVRYGKVSHGLMAYNIGPYGLEHRLRTGEALPVAYSRKILVQYHFLVQKFGRP